MDLKQELLKSAVGRNAWTRYRRQSLHRDYVARRDRYAAIAAARGIRYHSSAIPGMVSERFRARGYQVVRRDPGNVHTFAFIPRLGWHSALYTDLAELGPVSEFDYTQAGFSCAEFHAGATRRRADMNRLALDALRNAHARRPVDWVFVYASGAEILAETLRQMRHEVGAPLVNMCLDDKQSWSGKRLAGQRMGQIDVVRDFDLCWTSARVACEWYLVENAIPLYMPEGFDRAAFHPLAVAQDIEVSFIGGAYGFRPTVIRMLRSRGIDVRAYGDGWENPAVWGTNQLEVINRTVINLGMGGIGYSEHLTNVKTRDFEIPGCGGGVYLTSFNSDLAQHFIVGEEILCYANPEDLVELIRWYLAHRDEARDIARRGRERCLREHRWYHRYRTVCEILGILEPDAASARSERGLVNGETIPDLSGSGAKGSVLL